MINNNIKNYKQFNEMASYNETMTIEDLIYVLEQKDPNAFIVCRDLEMSDKEVNNLFILDDFIKIESSGMKMENVGYSHSFDGDQYDFYTYKIETDPNKLYGTMWSGSMSEDERSKIIPKLHEYKTIGDLIQIAKTIPNPSMSLFFMSDSNVNYEESEKGHSFAAPMALANYNIESYPLSRNEEMLSGNILTAFGFMSESNGRYKLNRKN